MVVNDSSSTSSIGSFHVGDRVRFRLAGRFVTGVIVEDRGAIGVGGRHLFVVKVQIDPVNVMVYELPAVKIEKAV